MADRVAEVRRIAIERRGVTPRLTGAGYTRAARRARPPLGFRAEAGNNVEGFLFPALYHFEGHTTAETLVANQLAAFEQRWRTVDLRPARHRGRTAYEVLTIASMVERETVAPEERRLVAAVIYNRLDRDMPLGIDATLRYGLGIPGTKPLTKTHLASSSPYNTRRFRGLPPTPIGNPGLASIRAAANPAPVDYLYYVRKPDKSTTSSPRTTKSSAGRRASTATPANRFERGIASLAGRTSADPGPLAGARRESSGLNGSGDIAHHQHTTRHADPRLIRLSRRPAVYRTSCCPAGRDVDAQPSCLDEERRSRRELGAARARRRRARPTAGNYRPSRFAVRRAPRLVLSARTSARVVSAPEPAARGRPAPRRWRREPMPPGPVGTPAGRPVWCRC